MKSFVEDAKVVLEKAAEDFSPPVSHTLDATASHNMLANVYTLISAVRKSLGIVALGTYGY